MPSPASRLSGVNKILQRIGYATVTVLGGGQGAVVAEQQLDRAVEELQTRSWWFNRELYTPTLSPRGFAHLPERFQLPEDADPQRAQRYALGPCRRLYNVEGKTYVWNASPTNLVADPFDLTTGSWTESNCTATESTGSQRPCNDPVRRGASLVTEDTAGTLAAVTQDIAAAGLTDGETYELGVYIAADKNSDIEGSTDTSVRLNGVSSGVLAVLNGRVPREEGTEWEYTRLTHEAFSGENTQTQDRRSYGEAGTPWHYVTFRRVYNTADGDLQVYLRRTRPPASPRRGPWCTAASVSPRPRTSRSGPST